MTKLDSVSKLLARDGRLQSLLRRAEAVESLNALVRGHLAAPLDQHCRVANLKNGVLTLQTESPAWAARLRYTVPQLLAALRADPRLESAFTTIRVSVVPQQVRRDRPGRRASLSSRSADSLRAAAEGMSDPRLAAALRRLARRGGRLS